MKKKFRTVESYILNLNAEKNFKSWLNTKREEILSSIENAIQARSLSDFTEEIEKEVSKICPEVDFILDSDNNKSCDSQEDEVLGNIFAGSITKEVLYAFIADIFRPTVAKAGDTGNEYKRRAQWNDELNKKHEELGYSGKVSITDWYSISAVFTFCGRKYKVRDYDIRKALANLNIASKVTSDDPEFKYSIECVDFKRDITIDQAILALKVAMLEIFRDKIENTGEYANVVEYDVEPNKEENTVYTWVLKGAGDIDPEFDRSQEKAFEKFKNMFSNGLRPLASILWAACRWGKCFVASECAKWYYDNIQKYDFITICSYYSDIAQEWAKIFEHHQNYKDRFRFITPIMMKGNPSIIKETIDSGLIPVVFVGLMDDKGETTKYKYNELHSLLCGGKKTYLIVDEAHQATKSPVTGKVLDEDEAIDGFNKKQIRSIARHALHRMDLTASASNILNEYTFDNYIMICSQGDMVACKKNWMDRHPYEIWCASQPEEKRNWNSYLCANPYGDVVEPKYLAFFLNEKVLGEALYNEGNYSLMEITHSEDGRTFKNEQAVLNILKCLDGSLSNEYVKPIFSFEETKEGQALNSILMVFDRVKSCSALKKLIETHKGEFKNLSEYQIYDFASETGSEESKFAEIVAKNASDGIKAIYLKVSRGLVGRTYPALDSFIWFSDSKSLLSKIQKEGRAFNPWSICTSDGERVIKKQKAIIIDLKPNRLITLANEDVYNHAHIINEEYADGDETAEQTRDRVYEYCQKKAEYEPVLIYSPEIGDSCKPIKVEAKDYMAAFEERIALQKSDPCEYAYNISLPYEIDNNSEIGEYLSRYNLDYAPFKKRQKTKDTPYVGVDEPDAKNNYSPKANSKGSPNNNSGKNKEKDYSNTEKIQKLISISYVVAIVYPEINSMDILASKALLNREELENSGFGDLYILKESGQLDWLTDGCFDKLKTMLPAKITRQIDRGMQNFSRQGKENMVIDAENIPNLFKSRLTRFSNDEYLTPWKIAIKQAETLKDKLISGSVDIANAKILNPCSKDGIYAAALVSVFGDMLPKDNIYAVATSPLAKFFTRYIFKRLGINQSNVSDDIYYEDIRLNNDKTKNYSQKMNFTATVGNPPYQITVAKKDTKNGQKRVSSIFHQFQLACEKISEYTCLIYPGGRWIHRSGKGLKDFGLKQINDPHLACVEFFPNSKEVFSEVDLPDGLSIVLKDMTKTTPGFTYVYTVNGTSKKSFIPNPGEKLIPLNPSDASIIEKINAVVSEHGFSFLHDSVLSQKLFGIESDFVEKNPNLVREYNDGDFFNPEKEVKLFVNDKAGAGGRAKWYVTDKSLIEDGKIYLDKWKVVVSSAHPGGQEKRDNCLSVLDNFSAFGRSRVALKTFESEEEAMNFYKYVNSEVIRFTFLLTDEALTSFAKLTPDIIDYSNENGIIDFNKDINQQLYAILGVDEEGQKHIKNVLASNGK